MIEELTREFKENTLFNNPAELVALVDQSIRDGTSKIHPWQLRLHHDFAKPTTDKNPFKGALRAANGSGKDKMGIAPCVVWLGTRYAQSNSIVTSSSGRQLDTQTDTYINQLCSGINRYFGELIWKCNYREYRNLQTGSVIDLFATDEPGKAEGAHPIVFDGQMGIFVSEAKNIGEDIYQALTRCNGFTKRLDVSSPGIASGHFYDICTRSEELKWKQYHITAFDCPHLSEEHINYVKIKYGENSVFYRSMVLAEFGMQDGELLVIPADRLYRLMKTVHIIEHFPSKNNVGGLDLSAGGDETVLVVRNGNKVIALEAFRIADHGQMIRHLESLFRKYSLDNINAPVWADAGGLGKPMIGQLRDRGWLNVQYVLNQWEPRDKIAYANLGTEDWFRFARLVEELEIIIPTDDLLEKQLVNRYYKVRQDNSFILESKIQARAKGHPSPDRADGIVLCFHDYMPTYLEKEHRKTQHVEVPKAKVEVVRTLRERAINPEQNVTRGFVRQPTTSEMFRLNFEVKAINEKLQGYFNVRKLLSNNKEKETNETEESKEKEKEVSTVV